MAGMLTEAAGAGRARPRARAAASIIARMHLLIPFAAPLSEAGRQALATLALPRLQALLGRMTEVERDEADEWCLSPPHERALARALGWQGGSGLLPWAAQAGGAGRHRRRRTGLGPAHTRALAPGHRPGQPARPGAADAGRGHLARAVRRRAAAVHRRGLLRCAGAPRCAGMWRTRAWRRCPARRWTASSAATSTAGWAATRRRGASAACKARCRWCCTRTR